jgi:hypothetical protein
MDACGRIKKYGSQHAQGLGRYKSRENMGDESKRMRDTDFLGKNEGAVGAKKNHFSSLISVLGLVYIFCWSCS